MSGYENFAKYYDVLTGNVDYPGRARYFSGLIKKHCRRKCEILLDLACGTGSLSARFLALGYDVIGVDSSPAMLSLAAEKCDGTGALFLCQKMQNLDLYGTVDGCVCALDSLNHLPDYQSLLETFKKVALFLAPGGVFLFDVNTPYKHLHILWDNTFVIEQDNLLCLWRNGLRDDGSVDIRLDFFERQKGGNYKRSSEEFCERLFLDKELKTALEASGFELLAIYGEDSLSPPKEDSQRTVWVAVRINS